IRDVKCAFKILPYVEKVKPEIIFSNSNDRPQSGMHYLSKYMNNFPPVVSIFHVPVMSEKMARKLKAKMSNSFEAVAVSEGVLQSYESAGVIRPGQGRTIYNPACAPNIDELAKIEPDHPWFSDGGPPVILGAGRLEPEKDFSTLIDAFRRLRASRPCRLVILGEGSLRSELEARIASLGLDDCVSLPGWVENPFSFMARSALFVLSSVYEGFGLVLVEALASGCPVVSTDCPAGPSEILEDPALLAPVGDPEALAQVMMRALDRPADKAALRASAARFSVERAIDGYETLIADVLAERDRPKQASGA
ncbi:MAG: glycosyltransferase, partial [Alphaproteobacteria bacterium]|nr:glycosyltransferase [Alphaproteobacteria bacterium]